MDTQSSLEEHRRERGTLGIMASLNFSQDSVPEFVWSRAIAQSYFEFWGLALSTLGRLVSGKKVNIEPILALDSGLP